MRRSTRARSIIITCSVVAAAIAIHPVFAVDCANPVMPEGALQYDVASATVKFCSVGTWLDTDRGNVSTGATCTTAGQIEYDPTVGQRLYRFCNGSNWRSMKGSSLGTCPAANAGLTSYNPGTGKFTFCDGTNLWDMTPGTACTPVVLTAGTTWTVGAHWNNSSNSVQVIGGGGGGGSNGGGTGGGAGGGGGGYSSVANVALTAGGNVTYRVGAGGAQDSAGGDTYFCNSTSNCASILGTAVIVAAEGGKGATNLAAVGAGADTSSAIGTIKATGGSGAPTANTKGGGGGGAGGAAGSGTTPTGQTGGVGDANTGGAGGTAGAVGGAGSELNGAGAGGGGGGGNNNQNGGAGGDYGGGGGGAGKNNGRSGGAGSGGVVIINYTSTTTCP